MSTLDKPQSSAENVHQRLDFESLVSDISSKFINLRPGEVDGEIEDALRRLSDPLGIDLAVLWQWSDLTPGIATATHVYTRQGVPAPGPLHQAQFPWYAQELLAGRTAYKLDGTNLWNRADISDGFSFDDLPPSEQAKTAIYAKDANGDPYAPSWCTLNLNGSYQVNKVLLVSAGVENITDQRYRPYSSGISSPGRNFTVGLRASF